MANDTLGDPGTSRRDGLLALAIAGIVLATVLIGDLGSAAPSHAALAPGDDPACAEWGDGCHVCRRTADASACSLPGIACTPGAMQCLRRTAGS